MPLLDRFDVGARRHISADEERRLFANGTLSEAFIPFAVHMANKFKSYGFDHMDLIQEANLILVESERTFNPETSRFATYAGKAIAYRLATYVFENKGPVRRPMTTAATRRVTRNLVTIDEAMPMLSLFIDDEDRPLHLSTSPPSDDHIDLERAMSVLTERERDIIVRRYCDDGGLYNNLGRPMREVGEDLGITKQRVEQIEKIALTKMRKFLTRGDSDGMVGST